jgi:hypothetical protein
VPSKAPSGIAGFDEIPGGVLPRGRTLVKLAPSSARRIVGTLSQTAPVLQAMGLDTSAP